MKTLIKFGLIICFMLIINSCNQSPSSILTTSQFIVPNNMTSSWCLRGRFFLFPDDTARFYGSRKCTVMVDNSIAKTVSDSVYYYTITRKPEFLTDNEKTYVVVPQFCQILNVHDSLDQDTLIRYYEITDSGTYQRAYRNSNGLHLVHKPFVFPYELIVGTNWEMSPVMEDNWALYPIFKRLKELLKGSITIAGYAQVANEISAYILHGLFYQDGTRLKIHYCFNGTIIEDNNIKQISGTIITSLYYFRDVGLLEQNITSLVQTISSNGSVTIEKEHIYIDRGRTPAKFYF